VERATGKKQTYEIDEETNSKELEINLIEDKNDNKGK